MFNVKLGKYARSVSIIGVGCTPFRETLADPEWTGISEGELFGYAAIEAMKDAGIEGKDIQFFYHGQANPGYTSNYITPAIHVAEWFGTRGIGSQHHSEGCCTGYLALDLAVNAVASGKYDMVLSGCIDMGSNWCQIGKPAHMRRELDMAEFMASLPMIYDRAYTRPLEAGMVSGFDDPPEEYQRVYGLTDEQIDDMLNAMTYANRKNASLNPKAIRRESFDDLAHEAGFETAKDYLRSPFNPKMSAYLRVNGTEVRADGAAAVIVCPTEMAREYTDKPIEVLAFGNSCLEARQVHLERRATEEAIRQAYDVSGVTPDEIDLLFANDFVITSQVVAAEAAGYLPKGEGWKFFIEGRTSYDGDRPINPNGGRTSFGHAHGASGLADVYEAVHQMRGDCGERQVKKLPRTTLLRGFGGGQNVSATILRTVE